MVFSPAALLAAWLGGLGPGVFSALIGVVLGDYFFTLPLHELGPYGPAEITLIATYLISTLVGVVLFHLLQRSREQIRLSAGCAETAAQEAQQRGVALQNEISERKRTAAALEHAQQQLNAYNVELEERIGERTADLQESLTSLESVLYHVAHDLRAPLRAMEGLTTLLLDNYAIHFDERGRDFGARISESSRRMDELLQDLLEYGRICHTQVFKHRVPLEKTVTTVISKFADRIEATSARIEIVHPLAVVKGDTKLMEEILGQVLSNSLKFVEAGKSPEIRIRSETRGATARIWIEDHGIGIERQLQGRIFNIFERAVVDPRFHGTGMGLAIVRKGADRMGGSVGVSSKPGEGSQFWIELPGAALT
jgi:signal transduction histidine kinase